MKKKALVICLCVAFVLAGMAATMAYFTDNDSATNTLSVGNVDITLDEADVDFNGKLESNDRVNENQYHLIPGNTYIKDPTVSIEPNSDEAYIRMIVTVEGYEELKAAFPGKEYYAADGTFLLQKLCKGWDESVWDFYKAENGKYEFRYTRTASNKTLAPVSLDALFEFITVPGEINNDQLANLKNVKIHVDAHAIQAFGFANENAAWAAFGQQTGLY